MKYRIATWSKRTGAFAGYEPIRDGGNTSFPLSFDSQAEAEAEAARLNARGKTRWTYTVSEPLRPARRTRGRWELCEGAV